MILVYTTSYSHRYMKIDAIVWGNRGGQSLPYEQCVNNQRPWDIDQVQED